MSTFRTLTPTTCGVVCVLVLDGVKGVIRFRICRVKNEAIYTKPISTYFIQLSKLTRLHTKSNLSLATGFSCFSLTGTCRLFWVPAAYPGTLDPFSPSRAEDILCLNVGGVAGGIGRTIALGLPEEEETELDRERVIARLTVLIRLTYMIRTHKRDG